MKIVREAKKFQVLTVTVLPFLPSNTTALMITAVDGEGVVATYREAVETSELKSFLNDLLEDDTFIKLIKVQDDDGTTVWHTVPKDYIGTVIENPDELREELNYAKIMGCDPLAEAIVIIRGRQSIAERNSAQLTN